MNSDFKKLKGKRFKEINDRLSKINAEKVRSFLLSSGYFPESQFLPNDFFTSKILTEVKNLKKIKGLDYKTVDEGTPSFIFFPKSKYTIRALGIPPAENYAHLCNFISDNWNKIRAHLVLEENDSIVPYTYPLFFDNKKRSDVSINNYKVYSELDIPRAANQFNYCVFLDIKNFYPSIYTHTLAWCLDPKTQEKEERFNIKNWANKLDSLTSKLYQSRTKGLLIGPHTSDLESEILLRTIDRNLSDRTRSKNVEMAGFRFKDDYVLFSNTIESADIIRKEMQQLLNDYHLEVNENKTRIVHADSFEDKKVWKVEVERIKDEINEVYKTVDGNGHLKISEKHVRFWLKKTQSLYDTYGDEYIIKTILGGLIKEKVISVSITKTASYSYPHNISLEEVYISIFSYISSMCKKVPSAWPLFMIFVCLCFQGSTNPKIRASIKVFLSDFIKSFIKSNDSFPLIWTLYVLWRCEIKITKTIIKTISDEYKENWLVMAFINSKSGTCSIGGSKFDLINKNRKDLKPLFDVISVFGYGSKK